MSLLRPLHALSAPVKVVVAYATFSALWILFSDRAVAMLFPDPAHFTLVSILKGWLFVAVTSVMLYGLVRRLLRRPAPTAEGLSVEFSWRWRLVVYLFAIATSLGALGLRASMDVPFAVRPMFLLFMAPIILSAFLGGLGPGLVATAVAALGLDWLFIPPVSSLGGMGSLDLFQWVLLVVNGLVVSGFSEMSHRSRHQIEAQRQLHEVTLESIGDAVLTTDAAGVVTFLNAAAERLTGWSCLEGTGKPLAEVAPLLEEGTEATLPDLVPTVLRSGITDCHGLLRAQGGRMVPVLGSAAPIRRPSGEPQGVVMVLRDDTERRHLARAQEERLEALHLLGFMADSSSDAIFAKDRQGRYLLFNREASRITGVPASEAIGKDDRALFPPEEAAFLMELGRKVVEEGASITGEEALSTTQGTRVFLATKEPLLDSQGQVVGLFGISRDITERKRTEELLRERLALQEQLADIALSVPGAICSYRLRPDGTACMPFTTPAIEDLYGLSRAELAETMEGWAARVHPEDLVRVLRAIEEAAKTMSPWHDGFRYRHPEKGLRWIEGWSIPRREPDGSMLWSGFLTDVTERMRNEEALRESEASLERAQAIARLGSWRRDLVTGGLTWSLQAHHIFGIPAGSPLDEDGVLARVPAADQDRVRKAWREMEAGKAFDLEHRLVTEQGERWVRQQAEIRKDAEGRPLVAFGIIQDITEHRQAEDEKGRLQAQILQAQKMESIGRLAGGVAHDFNNMLQVIAGNAELALGQVAPGEPLHGEIQLIQKAAGRSAELTRQLLAFARRQTIAPKVIDLNDALGSMLKMMGRLVGEDTRLVWAPRAGLWKVRIDPAQLDQVVANLTVNARDAISGVGTITLQTDNEVVTAKACEGILGASPGDYVTLSVEDTGSGMGPEVLEHIFEPFFTTKEAGRGTGLGLATVFGIAQQNGGFVRVSSRLGEGSRFRVSFPRWQEAAEESAPEGTPGPREGRGETILLVEDEEALLAVGEAMLKALGYAVLAMSSPEEALRRVAGNPGRIDLFLVDVVMPGMNGKELARRLGDLRPGVPVLFMSGYTADVIANRGTLEEGLRLIEKPFTLRDLSVRLREILDAPA